MAKIKIPPGAPYAPVLSEVADRAAFRAVAQGEASGPQQMRAMRFLIDLLCETYGMSYRPSSDRDTAFAEGKRFVGSQIVGFINTKGSKENG